MSDFSFLAVPNIEGMRLGWYIQIFGIALLFGVCLFVVLSSLLKYRRTKRCLQQVAVLDRQTLDFEKHLLIQHIQKSSGKDKLVLFIEYLERFVTLDTYANLGELLYPQGFTAQQLQEFEQVLYADAQVSKELAHAIDVYFSL